MNMKNGIDAALLSHDQAVVQGYPKDPLNHSMVGLSLAADMVRGGERSIANAGRLKVPLLLMHGEEDGICDVEGSRAFAKNAEPTAAWRPIRASSTSCTTSRRSNRPCSKGRLTSCGKRRGERYERTQSAHRALDGQGKGAQRPLGCGPFPFLRELRR